MSILNNQVHCKLFSHLWTFQLDSVIFTLFQNDCVWSSITVLVKIMTKHFRHNWPTDFTIRHSLICPTDLKAHNTMASFLGTKLYLCRTVRIPLIQEMHILCGFNFGLIKVLISIAFETIKNHVMKLRTSRARRIPYCTPTYIRCQNVKAFGVTRWWNKTPRAVPQSVNLWITEQDPQTLTEPRSEALKPLRKSLNNSTVNRKTLISNFICSTEKLKTYTVWQKQILTFF